MVSRYGSCLLIAIMNVTIRKFAAEPLSLLTAMKEVSGRDEFELASLSPIPILLGTQSYRPPY